MTCPIEKTLQNGPPSQLISCINHLGNLLKNLPTMVPLDPELSRYNFGLDDEDVKEEGMWYAFNQNLEACFKTHKIPPNGSIVFQKHGIRLEGLVKLIKIVVKGITNDAEHNLLQDAWLERLIQAAELQRAKVPDK